VVIFYLYLAKPFSNECIQGNCKNGNGVYLFHSGMKYDGEWKNGKRYGQGTLTYLDGSKYTGKWENNRMHGKGMKIYSSDRLYKKYIGDWKNGNKHGIGYALYSGGSSYEGEWKNGKEDGHGTITLTDGKKIIGNQKNGIFYGTVTEIFPDGKIWTVGRKNNLRYGRGTVTYPDGTKETREWINNKLVGSLEYYFFYYFEFSKHYNITKLCNTIKADINLSLNAHENTLEWLNELLKFPNYFDNINKKIQDKRFSKEIDVLLEATKNIRKKKFTELNYNSQKDIIKLNRLLLEHYYPYRTPKS
jgi:hypothetical protein